MRPSPEKAAWKWRTARLSAVLLLCFAVTGPVRALADIYRYVDKDGVAHYSNMPNNTKYQLYLKEGATTRRAAPRIIGSSGSGALAGLVWKSGKTVSAYDHYIREAAVLHHLDANLVKAVIKIESAFNPGAVSNKGAKGLMQIMPMNFQDLGITDPFDPRQSIQGGTQYLREMLDRFEGNLALALAAYNAGPSMVEKYKRIPPIDETERYVSKVLRQYYQYRIQGNGAPRQTRRVIRVSR
jgi:soluble lytic murein transglycosylase